MSVALMAFPLPLAFVLLAVRGVANEVGECPFSESAGAAEGGQALLQKGLSETRSQLVSENRRPKEKRLSLSWTTNVGQEHHSCEGSAFEMDYAGTHSGMVVQDGMLLKKGSCPLESDQNSTLPSTTQGISCEAEATGCHMWCAPVWQSFHDSTNWSAFDDRCKGWDGAFHSDDALCADAGRLFTWARTTVPDSHNGVDITFAITSTCDSWCAPMWVTIYDPVNWAKSYRWCFNRRDEWGGCDNSEDVSVTTWHDRKFMFWQFMQKHGYTPEQYAFEIAVYSEFDSAEVVINSLKLFHKDEPGTRSLSTVSNDTDTGTCGPQLTCGDEHHCCRKADSEVDAMCCPISWSCCEDSCCPQFYTCTITDAGHTCLPPVENATLKTPPSLCKMVG